MDIAQPARTGEELKMYEDQYTMTALEQADVKMFLDRIATYGKLIRHDRSTGQPVLDTNGQAVISQFEKITGSPTLRSRYIIDSKGVVWPFMSRGASKCPHLPDGGGSRALSDYVEMWTGKWRKVKHPKTGAMTYAKNTIYVNMEGHVQGHPYVAKIEWMKQTKGYRHPLDEPSFPPGQVIASLESKRRSLAPIILAKTQEALQTSGLEKAGEYIEEAKTKAAEMAQPVEPPVVIEPERREEPAAPPAPLPDDIRISDNARAYADAQNIDLATITGTGKNGRICIGDVRPGRSNKR